MGNAMNNLADSLLQRIEQEGYAVLPAIFSPEQAATIRRELMAALAAETKAEGAIRSEAGSLYAARNLLTLWPPVAVVWKQPALLELLAAVLGPGFGLVRVLYFDKPPNQTWALPWHKDMTISVQNNRLPSQLFGKPTRKAGVPHVEAPQAVLERMLTARLHLDAVTEENGPLKVIPGSHRLGKKLSTGTELPHTILAQEGDVLLVRPLVEHSSGRSHPETQRHRRILHLEFAADAQLPDGYAWHDFQPGLAVHS